MVAKPAAVETWLRDLKGRKNEAGRPVANTKQYVAVAVVVDDFVRNDEGLAFVGRS